VSFPFEAVLYVFLLLVAWLVIRSSNLFAAVMLTAIFSLLCTGIYTLVDAVDVAFTEAAVGTGISTVLFLGTLALTGEEETRSKSRRLPAILVVSLVGGALLYGTVDMPLYGDFSAPIHHHVADRYVEKSGEEVGMPNIVTSVLASYRGYDTFGETTVVFTAAVGVILLIGGAAPRKRGQEACPGGMEPAPQGEEDQA
jgi:multicomponent Na+:H+ antiporter subunit B